MTTKISQQAPEKDTPCTAVAASLTIFGATPRRGDSPLGRTATHARMRVVGDLLPNAFIIGAAKCGTTSLWLHLDAHPEISFSTDKEPAFFVREDYREELDSYERLFRPAPVRGEASTLYTTYPVYEGVPSRMQNVVPDARLIYIVRDPIERAVSHYIEQFARGSEDRRPDEALTAPESHNLYVAASLFATQVQQYLECFDASQLLIVDQAELRDDPESTLREIYAFLGVDPGFRPPHLGEQVRRTEERRRLTGVGDRLRRTGAAEASLRLIWRLPPRVAIRVIGALKRPVSARIDRPALDPELRDRLHERFAPEADWLRDYTGKAFSAWSC